MRTYLQYVENLYRQIYIPIIKVKTCINFE